MKKLLLASAALALVSGAASAADLPRRAAPVPVFVAEPAFSWSGVYIGTHTAYTFMDSQRVSTVGNDPVSQGVISGNLVPGSVSTRNRDGFANFGGGVGINYQLTPGSGFVIGAALDADWTDLHRDTLVFSPVGGLGNTYSRELSWLATFNGRVGYAFDHFLVYGVGGAAIGHVKYGQSLIAPAPIGLAAFGGDGGNSVGYDYGGGIEYALPKDNFLNNFSVLKLLGINLGGTTTLKAEYIHFDLGKQNVTVNGVGTFGGGFAGTSRFKTSGDMIRAGFSYKFP